MRWLAVLLILPAASAAFVDDPAGDVDVVVEGHVVGNAPEAAKQSVDILGFDIEETSTDFVLRLEMAARAGAGDEPVKDWGLEIWFKHGEAQYLVSHSEFLHGSAWTRLYEVDPAGGVRSSGPLSSAWEDTTLVITLPRQDIPTHDGAPPTPATTLHDIRIHSIAPELAASVTGLFPSFVTNERYSVVLRDDAASDDAYAIQQGLEQGGTGRLHSQQPFRVSNGEASTFVYWVNATRISPGTGTYSLRATGVPDGWGVEVPTGRFEIGASPWRFPVVVHTAFAHAHGSTQSFVLELHDHGGGVARLEMGILYPEIPQPAGHHNTLYLRSQPGGNVLWSQFAPVREPLMGNGGHEAAYMNAAEEDENDLGAPVDFWRCGPAGVEVVRCLEVPLVPSLQMGLDFRIDENGTLEFEVDAPVPMLGAVATAELVHFTLTPSSPAPGVVFYDRDETVLATADPSEPFDLSAGGSRALDFQFKPTRAADLVRYEQAASLSLKLRISYTSVPDPPLFFVGTEVAPRLLPGGAMVLPLDEYKDPVEDLPSLGGGLAWTVNTTQREANPGDVVVFQAKLTNEGHDDTFSLRLVGHNREWAAVDADTVRLGQNASRSFMVVVRVPQNAAVQSSADLVLEAASTSDVSRRSLLQLRTIVTDVPVGDDAALVAQWEPRDKKSPVAAPLAALALAWLAARPNTARAAHDVAGAPTPPGPRGRRSSPGPADPLPAPPFTHRGARPVPTCVIPAPHLNDITKHFK